MEEPQKIRSIKEYYANSAGERIVEEWLYLGDTRLHSGDKIKIKTKKGWRIDYINLSMNGKKDWYLRYNPYNPVGLTAILIS